MARKARTGIEGIVHGKRATYVRGCRCKLCCEANTQYGKDLKARKRRGEKIQPAFEKIQAPEKIQSPLASVTKLIAGVVPPPDPPAPDPDEPGSVEIAVMKEMRSLSAFRRRPGLVESVRSMAKVLDNPEAVTTHPSAHRQLTMGLEKLWSESVGRKGTLAEVAAMSNRDRSTKQSAK